MAAFSPQVMEAASHIDSQIRKTFLRIAKGIFENATAFDACNHIFNHDA